MSRCLKNDDVGEFITFKRHGLATMRLVFFIGNIVIFTFTTVYAILGRHFDIRG